MFPTFSPIITHYLSNVCLCFSDLMENGTVPVIDSSKMPKSLSVLPDNNNMESIV